MKDVMYIRSGMSASSCVKGINGAMRTKSSKREDAGILDFKMEASKKPSNKYGRT
jgi:formate-dependent nitrite reductase membrane component NrfD